jgi:hypothetical protein
MFPSGKLGILAAFPYCKSQLLAVFQERAADIDLFLDSGAFTAWNAGKTVALNDYCTFIETAPIRPWRYLMLDVVGQPEATRVNLAEMRRRGLDPVPIFTRGEDPSILEDYYASSEFVAWGGVTGVNTNSTKWLLKARELAGQNMRRTHILGMTRPNIVHTVRPYSIDSSTWSCTPRYGHIMLYMGNGNLREMSRPVYRKQPPSREFMRRLDHYGVARLHLEKDDYSRGVHSPLLHLSSRSCMEYAIDVERALGVRYIFAVGSAWAAKKVFDAYDWVKANRKAA